MGWGYRVHLFCAGYIITWASPILSQTSSDVVKRGLGSTVQKAFIWPFYRILPMRKGRIRTGDWEVHQRELNKPEVKNLRNLSKESELININMFQVCITKLKKPKNLSVIFMHFRKQSAENNEIYS